MVESINLFSNWPFLPPSFVSNMHYTVSKWFVGGPLEWRLRRRQYNTTDWAIGKKNKKVWERNEALYTRGVCEYPSCPRGNIPLSVKPQHRWIVLRLCSHQREQTHKCLNHTVALWGSCCSYCICPQCVIFHCHGRHRKKILCLLAVISVGHRHIHLYCKMIWSWCSLCLMSFSLRWSSTATLSEIFNECLRPH